MVRRQTRGRRRSIRRRRTQRQRGGGCVEGKQQGMFTCLNQRWVLKNKSNASYGSLGRENRYVKNHSPSNLNQQA